MNPLSFGQQQLSLMFSTLESTINIKIEPHYFCGIMHDEILNCYSFCFLTKIAHHLSFWTLHIVLPARFLKSFAKEVSKWVAHRNVLISVFRNLPLLIISFWLSCCCFFGSVGIPAFGKNFEISGER
jgi:ABC-type amino acid transport system permease subunit